MTREDPMLTDCFENLKFEYDKLKIEMERMRSNYYIEEMDWGLKTWKLSKLNHELQQQIVNLLTKITELERNKE